MLDEGLKGEALLTKVRELRLDRENAFFGTSDPDREIEEGDDEAASPKEAAK